MNIEKYKAGKYKKQYQYESFMPTAINSDWQISNIDLIKLLSEADIKLGELNAFSELVPNIDFFIKMHVFKEATTSSRIEGTQTNIAEAVQKENLIDPEKKDDWLEVQNYVQSMNKAIESLNELPISNRLLCNIHNILLQGARGKHKSPGEFRRNQNWIGGASINDAVFIPPHHSDLPDLMSDFEKFLNNDEIVLPHLIKIGIAHYQFETIHPFLDGNGRIGRLLITLYLVSRGLLVKPTLYLSDYFEKNKALYYDNLTRVRTHNDLLQWLKFFLVGIRNTAESSISTFRSIITLRQDVEYNRIITMGKKTKLARQLLHYLYNRPVISSQGIAKELNINASTALRIIEDFVKLDILKERTGFKRNRVFAFEDYLKLFE